MTIDWENLPTYNTIMAVAVGTGLLLVVRLGWDLLRSPREPHLRGYALAFAVLGALLATTGLHMTLTWPLAPLFPFDNIVFGEPSLAFGVLLLGASLHLWRDGERLQATEDPRRAVSRAYGPLSLFVLGMGLACFAIAAAGVRYQLFAAPPQEPISGEFADHPWVEALFISGLYALVGLGAVLFPLALRSGRVGATARTTGAAWGAAGLAFLLFGALNYFTHIGLIVNTMP